MLHKAIELTLKEGTLLEVKFRTGEVKQYDMKNLFSKYPQLAALEDRKLFLSGRLVGKYGIIWNEELDIETETIYEDGILVRTEEMSSGFISGDAVLKARLEKGLSQKELADLSGIDQSDISKIERGAYNPSVDKLNRIAKGLGKKLVIDFVD